MSTRETRHKEKAMVDFRDWVIEKEFGHKEWFTKLMGDLVCTRQIEYKKYEWPVYPKPWATRKSRHRNKQLMEGG